MIILGIETSCDETAVSVVEAKGDLESLQFKVLGSSLHSQVEMHREYGGVVPNLAKREHQKNLPLVLAQALKEAGFENKLWDVNYELWQEKNPNIKFPIDMIAVTIGPGLEPALWTGIAFAEELGKKWNVPIVGTNHMEGHIASVLLNEEEGKIQFPALALLISGGHTELVYLKDWTQKEKIGETKDDAVGEAFDKVARMLGLPYPGGPEISKLAEEAREKNIVNEKKFPRPMIHSKDFNFSFSGLKTSVLYYLKNLTPNPSPYQGEGKIEDIAGASFRSATTRGQGNFQQKISGASESNISDFQKIAVAREFEDAVIETLLSKTKGAVDKYLPKTLIIGGGVISNKSLRENFLDLEKTYPELKVLIPTKPLTTDNAVMIAAAGYIEYLRDGVKTDKLKANGNLSIN